MLAVVVFVPSAPLLVPELAGPAAFDTEPVRAAVDDVVGDGRAAGADRWILVGASDDPATGVVQESGSGGFGRFGVDVRVRLHDGTGPRMSLSALIGAWLRERGGLDPMEPLIVGRDTAPGDCATLGAGLGQGLRDCADRVGLLVVGDGSFALTPKSPGGERRESAVALNDAIVAAVGDADTRTLAALDPQACAAEGVAGRVAWQVAAAAVEQAGRPVVAKTRYADAPFGVGYIAATWTLDDRS